jgi:Domain of unknown function (DUF4873)
VAAGRIPVIAIVVGEIGAVADIGAVACTTLDSADSAHFDDATDTWTAQDRDGRSVTARLLIDARPSDERTLAVHGIPNYFRIPGPDVAAQTRLVSRAIDLLERSESTRIEAKGRITLRRFQPRSLAARFYLSGSAPDDDLYEGPAVITLSERDIEVRARLTGHLDAIDGAYHWRGTVSGDLPDDLMKGQRTVDLSVDGRRVAARFGESTPWGNYTIAGTGAPPYPLN